MDGVTSDEPPMTPTRSARSVSIVISTASRRTAVAGRAVSGFPHPTEQSTAIQKPAFHRRTPTCARRIAMCGVVSKCILSRWRRMSMKWKSVVPLLALVCATLGTATPLLAQAVQTSTLTGTIKDATGAVLPGVTVNVSSPQQVGGVQTSVTDSQGVYRFPALHPGVYEMETTLA